MFVTRVVGVPVPSPFFLTSWLRPRILLFLTLASRSSWFCRLMPSLVAIVMNCCFAPSEPFVSTWPGWNSVILVSKVCSSRWISMRNGCPEAPFPFGCVWWLLWLMRPFQRRIVGLWGSELTKSGRLWHLCCLRGTALFIRYWRWGWSAQSTFSSFYPRDVTHKHLNTFSIGPAVMTQQVV